MDLHDVRREPPCDRRNLRHVIAADREHDRLRGDGPARRLHPEAAAGYGADPRGRDSLMDRRAGLSRISFDISDDLVSSHEAVRLRAVVRMAGELALPVRRHEAERVPALRAPGVRNAVLFDDHVLDAPTGELMAHRKAGLAAADHDDGNGRRKSGMAHGSLLKDRKRGRQKGLVHGKPHEGSKERTVTYPSA